MKTLLCCIGRNENQYIREYVEYYKNLGVTNICLFDNNYDGEEHFEDVIGDYIESGFVILKNYRNRKTCQIQAYEECYQLFNKEYDWILYFDCDEFLTFTQDKTIEEYLSRDIFKDFDAIKLNWMIYGDGGNARSDGRPLLERITEPVLPYNKCVGYNFPENNHIKSIVRTLPIQLKFMGNPHVTNLKKQCNNKGEACVQTSLPFEQFDYTLAYLRHYSTKTADEYCNKMIKGFPDREWDIDKEAKFLIKTRFFNYNEVTKEKVEIFKDRLGIDLNFLLPQEKFKGEKRKDVQLFELCYEKKDYAFDDTAIMTPLQCGAANGKDVCDLKDNTGENISSSNFTYAENTGIYWIWKNVKDAKYKGQTQYRRRLDGIDENTDFDAIFENYDIICAKPYNYPENYAKFIPAKTVINGYGYSHCADDINLLGEVIRQKFPDYFEDWQKYIVKGENLYYSNGFILPSEKYDEYCNFLFNVLGMWLGAAGIDTYEKMIVRVTKHIYQNKYPRYAIEGRDIEQLTWPEIQYQLRILAYLAERVFTLWLCHNIPEEKRYETTYTKMEDTYI